MIYDAREAFREPDFTKPELDRIFAALGERTVRLPGNPRQAPDLGPFFVLYARRKDWHTGLPVGRATFFRALKRLRADPTAPARCRDLGLGVRRSARLLGVSIPTAAKRLREAANR